MTAFQHDTEEEVGNLKDKTAKSDKRIIIRRLWWLLPGPVFYGLFRLSFLWPSFTENVYSRAIFRATNQGLSSATGILPFSLGEFLLYAALLFACIYIIITIVRAVKAKRKWWMAILKRLLWLLCAVSFVYALFISLWGFNYARQPLGTALSLNTAPATVSELYATCETLLEEATLLREEVPQDENGVFLPEKSKEAIMLSTTALYRRAADVSGFDMLGGAFGRVKPVVYSIGLSKANITGVYFPFTGEANVNADVPMLMFGATCLHEAAHQRGYAREDEANFLAYYVSKHSGDNEVEYSGVMLALLHAMNKLYAQDQELYFALRAKYTKGMNADLADNNAYWKQFDSPVAELSEQINDSFLKANRQEDGVKSYGRMVDLLIGLWRKGAL